MKKNKENFVAALVVGPRKRDVGLVAPTKFTAVTKGLRIATILSAEIKLKKKNTHFELRIAEFKIVKQRIAEVT